MILEGFDNGFRVEGLRVRDLGIGVLGSGFWIEQIIEFIGTPKNT